MSAVTLYSYRAAVDRLVDEGTELRDAMQKASRSYPHPLNTQDFDGIIEIRNDFINRFGAKDVFREAIRRFKAELPYCNEAVLMVGAPGSGKSTLAQKLKKPGRLIFDSCSYTPGARKGLLRMCGAAGKPARCVFVDEDYTTCLVRNSKRTENMKVEPAIVTRAFTYLLALPPHVGEGFVSVDTFTP